MMVMTLLMKLMTLTSFLTMMMKIMMTTKPKETKHLMKLKMFPMSVKSEKDNKKPKI